MKRMRVCIWDVCCLDICMYVIPVCSRETNDGGGFDRNERIAGEFGSDGDCLPSPRQEKEEWVVCLHPSWLGMHGKLPEMNCMDRQKEIPSPGHTSRKESVCSKSNQTCLAICQAICHDTTQLYLRKNQDSTYL